MVIILIRPSKLANNYLLTNKTASNDKRRIFINTRSANRKTRNGKEKKNPSQTRLVAKYT